MGYNIDDTGQGADQSDYDDMNVPGEGINIGTSLGVGDVGYGVRSGEK